MATTEDQPIERADACKGACPVAAGEKLPHGTLCFADADGLAVDAAGGNELLGVVEPAADNSGGADSELVVEYNRQGQFRFTVTGGVTQADITKKVYAIDNNALTKTATDNSYVGTIAEVINATDVMVDLDTQAV